MPAKQIAYEMDAREAVRRGVKQLARAVKATLGPCGRNVVIEKSFGAPTVTKDGVTVDVASNPEFLREGSAIEDFLRPNRVVIGADSEQAVAIMRDLYSPLYLLETPFVVTNVASAEISPTGSSREARSRCTTSSGSITRSFSRSSRSVPPAFATPPFDSAFAAAPNDSAMR